MAEGFGKVLFGAARGLLALLGGVAGYQVARWVLSEGWFPWTSMSHVLFLSIVCVVLFGAIGYLLTPFFLKSLGFIGLLFENHLQALSWHDLSVAILGLIVGLLVANLVALPFADLPAVGSYIAVLLNVALGYIGIRLFLKRREEIQAMWSTIGGLKERIRLRVPRSVQSDQNEDPGSRGRCNAKILDTSVLIDGRILDVAETGFLEGSLVLPRFVLLELQAVADSSDPVRRSRGRRGLDVVSSLQKIPNVAVEIIEVPLKQLAVESVDEGLVALARQIGGKVMTTDYNLNKLAQIDGVNVLNVNDLSNALKPMLLPGENVVVDLIREGKEAFQGVGYLDDGTMIVVEEGRSYIGHRVEVTVTSMLQTSAGRMVFGRIRREVPK
ncbi:MAG: twitching motility protein PilT [Synergistaceae bacterium]|jgi:uncharacterized protein YacL|nr:twitching motility protein PilT [Synergistaceae bacterium]